MGRWCDKPSMAGSRDVSSISPVESLRSRCVSDGGSRPVVQEYLMFESDIPEFVSEVIGKGSTCSSNEEVRANV